MPRSTPHLWFKKFQHWCRQAGGDGFPKHASRRPCAARAPPSMAPHGFGKPSPPACPYIVLSLAQLKSRVVWAGRFFQNLAEPWMAEQSVHGRIHSVFWKNLPAQAAPPKVKTRAGEENSHDGRNKQRDPGIPDRSEATASPDDPLPVLEQGNLPS